MKPTQKIRSLILCMLSFSVIIQAEITEPKKASEPTEQEISLTPEQKAELLKIIEFAEKSINKAFSSLQKIENILTEVALLVRKGSLNLPTSKLQEIMALLTENKMTVNALLNSQSEIAQLQDPTMYLEYSYLITEFCNAFIPYFNEQIKNSFKDAKPFDLKKFVMSLNKAKTRSKGQHLKPENLKQGLRKTNSELATLSHSVKNIGLTWYNKVFRKVDQYVVAPANKYNIPTIAAYGTYATLFSLYLVWRFGYLIEDNPSLPEAFKSLITFLPKKAGSKPLESTPMGPQSVGRSEEENPFPAQSHSDGRTIPTDASLFAVIDYATNQLMSSNLPLATFVGVPLYTSFSETWKEKIYPKLTEKRDDFWNFLRGGEYRKNRKMGLNQIKPTYTFKDMVGLDNIKESFSQIIQYIDDPEQLMRIEATPEKGWLLTGPTRTGKSFSVECLCGEIEMLMAKRGKANTIKFFNIDSFLVNKYGIKDILEQVRENAPAVIFIDEIDLLGLNRVGNNQLLSEFLTSMQSSMNADPSKIVIVIAATNNPQNIDKALRQNGRFGKEIRFEYPSRKYRVEFIRRELAAMAVDLTQFNIESLANRTNQRSFEDLKAIIRNAMTRAWFKGESLTQELLEYSIDTEIHHILPFNHKDLPESELRVIATHFAGRALATTLLETHEKLDKVTIHAHMTDLKDELVWDTLAKKDDKDHQQKIEYGYLATKQPYDTINVKTQDIIMNEAISLIAGFAAEELILNSCGFTCHANSRDRAFKIITDLVFGGLNSDALPKEVNQQLKLQAYNLLKKCHVDAMKLLQTHRTALIALTDELMSKKIMTDTEVQAVIDKVEGRTTQASEADATKEVTA
ncbi:MAG TPA: ATP-binding protein [Candidatus Babeliales bacterium]|nr:ATP-binding protein [Candidatus Babeliales bacterium]